MSIKLELEQNEIEGVIAGLRKLPMELVEELVMKIKIQAIPQLQAVQNPQTPADASLDTATTPDA